MKQQMGMGILKIGAALAIVLLFVIIHVLAPEFLPELFTLLASGDIPATVEYIRSFGEWAIVFAFLLTLFTNALGFPPSSSRRQTSSFSASCPVLSSPASQRPSA